MGTEDLHHAKHCGLPLYSVTFLPFSLVRYLRPGANQTWCFCCLPLLATALRNSDGWMDDPCFRQLWQPRSAAACGLPSALGQELVLGHCQELFAVSCFEAIASFHVGPAAVSRPAQENTLQGCMQGQTVQRSAVNLTNLQQFRA